MSGRPKFGNSKEEPRNIWMMLEEKEKDPQFLFPD
jgi:hypothetical protein